MAKFLSFDSCFRNFENNKFKYLLFLIKWASSLLWSYLFNDLVLEPKKSFFRLNFIMILFSSVEAIYSIMKSMTLVMNIINLSYGSSLTIMFSKSNLYNAYFRLFINEM